MAYAASDIDRRSGPESDRGWIGGDPRAMPDAKVRLFCFAHAGGGTAFFHPWRVALAPSIDVRPILLPGRESRVRELPYRRMEQLLAPLCSALVPFLDRPYGIFGHSMGAVIAFEVARRLGERTGRGPRCLIVSGRRAPRLPSSRRLFSSLPDEDFLAEMSALNGTPPEVLESQVVRVLLPALRADFELNETYRRLPGGPLECPIAAYTGAADPEADPGELLAWHEETTHEFALRVFPGDHFYLKGGRPDVFTAVRQDLDRAGAAVA